MDTRGFVGTKKIGIKFGTSHIRKKAVPPTIIEKSKQHNFRQINQVESSTGPRKPFRMNSVNKPTRGISNQFNYGINGINYVKKKEYDQYEYDLEEAKAKANFNDDYVPSAHRQLFGNNKMEADDDQSSENDYDATIKTLAERVEQLERKLQGRDLEIKRVKCQNQRLKSEKVIMESKLIKMMKEDEQAELERQAEEEQDVGESNDDEQQLDDSQLHKHLFKMLMQANVYENEMQRDIEEQRENEMLEKAIQESLKDNPNPDVMNYEQLQELEDKIGYVNKGFSDVLISSIPIKVCNSTKSDCSVCLEDIKIGEKIKILSCGHEFHNECIDECFKTTKKCPYCMYEHQFEQ
jgi:hypothetical protein